MAELRWGLTLPFAGVPLAADATVPVYEAFFRGLGWGDAVDPMVEAWRGGDRRLALERVPLTSSERSSSSATRPR